MPAATVREAEVARFDALAARWWDPDGPMRPLHRMNPARIAWIVARIAEAFPAPAGLALLDVGCGAGLAAEALAAQGFDVLGIDAAAGPIAAAAAHLAEVRAAGMQAVGIRSPVTRSQAMHAQAMRAQAMRAQAMRAPAMSAQTMPAQTMPAQTMPALATAAPDGGTTDNRAAGHRGAGERSAQAQTAETGAARHALKLAYRVAAPEDLLAEGLRFPIITALEVIEHAADPEGFVATIAGLLAPGGLLVLSTLNRTVASFAAAKLAAEYLLRWLPVGTHDWRRFVTPAELGVLVRAAGLRVSDVTGLAPAGLSGGWRTGAGTAVNYLLAARR